MFVEINTRDANNLGVRDGAQVWVEGPEGGKVKVMAMVTERVGEGVAFMPFHFGGHMEGVICGINIPKVPILSSWVNPPTRHKHMAMTA